jgi:ABC-type antimicrobial peptide transport system permease subunit
MRSVLTMLGIVIGIAAIMLKVGLGEGAQGKVKATRHLGEQPLDRNTGQYSVLARGERRLGFRVNSHPI